MEVNLKAYLGCCCMIKKLTMASACSVVQQPCMNWLLVCRSSANGMGCHETVFSTGASLGFSACAKLMLASSSIS